MRSSTKKQSFDYSLISTCWHEASHTVCAIYHYFKVFKVSVITEHNEDGNAWTMFDFYTEEEKLKDEKIRSAFFKFQLEVFYAGMLGEKKYYQEICGSKSFPTHLRSGWRGDTKSISSIIKDNELAKPGKNTLLLKKQVQKDVEQFLSDHWDTIRIVAHALYKKKRLSFDDIKYLLTRKSNEKEFWKECFKKISLIHVEPSRPEDMLKEIVLG